MKRRQFVAASTLVLAGCKAPQIEGSEDLQIMLYYQINEIREMNDREPLERDPELEREAMDRAADGLDEEDEKVTPVSYDRDVSTSMKAKLIVYAWLRENDLYKTVLNREIERYGIGVYEEPDRYNITLNVQ